MTDRPNNNGIQANSESKPPGDVELAMKYAVDTRNFEIDLYWRRAAYFWTLLAAAFAGYVAIETDTSLTSEGNVDPYEVARFFLSCVGLMLSVAWYMVNRGSKFWQKTWERHVDLLSEHPAGEMFRSRLTPETYKLRDLLEAFPFSVSKVNQGLSLFAAFVWVALTLRSAPFFAWPEWTHTFAPHGFGIVTLGFIVWLFVKARTDKEEELVEVTMITREVKRKTQSG
jgi:hypothetical protein